MALAAASLAAAGWAYSWSGFWIAALAGLAAWLVLSEPDRRGPSPAEPEAEEEPAIGEKAAWEGGEPWRLPIEDSLDLHTFAPRDIPGVTAEYLEQSHRVGFREVRIIHGRGTGLQRDRVRRVLSGHPLVETFADAPPERGGWGATVVRLRGR